MTANDTTRLVTGGRALRLLSRCTQVDRADIAKFAPVLALAVIVVIGAIAAPTFVSLGNIRTILLASAIMMVFTIGQTFVISTAGIDLSVSAIAQLSGVVMGVAIGVGVSIWLGMLAALAVGALAGAMNGFIVSKLGVTDFITTLGTFGAYTGLTLLVSNAHSQPIISPVFITIATSGFGLLSYLLIIALVTAALGYFVMFYTPFGTRLLAVGGNRVAATNLGISFGRIKIGVYAISGLLSAVAGILLAARLGAAAPDVGSSYQLTSIAAAVLGGVSLFGGKTSIIGPLIGAIVLTSIVNLLVITGVIVFYQPIAVGIIVILAAYLRKYER